MFFRYFPSYKPPFFARFASFWSSAHRCHDTPGEKSALRGQQHGAEAAADRCVAHEIQGLVLSGPQWSGGVNSPTFGIPSGKQPHNYGKSQFLMGKSTINGHFQ